MSASAHRYSCDQLGACQSRSTPCSTCTSTRPRTSEGTASDQRLQGLRPWDAPSSRPMSLDGLDLHRVHHVDTHDLGHGDGVSVGGTCLPPPSASSSSADRRVDIDLQRLRRSEEVHPDERDPAARALFWRLYLGAMVAGLSLVGWGAWQMLAAGG